MRQVAIINFKPEAELYQKINFMNYLRFSIANTVELEPQLIISYPYDREKTPKQNEERFNFLLKTAGPDGVILVEHVHKVYNEKLHEI